MPSVYYKELLYKKHGLDPFYSVDYYDTKDVRWVRHSFCLMDEVQEILGSLPYERGENNRLIPQFKKLRVLPEAELSKPYRVYDPETEEFSDSSFSVREYYFGKDYEDYARVFTESSVESV